MDDRLSVDIPRSPMEQIERMDTDVELAALDEELTMFDPDTSPRDHYACDPDEPACDHKGKTVDLQADTPNIDNMATFELPEIGGDLF